MKYLIGFCCVALANARPQIDFSDFMDNTYLPPKNEHCEMYLEIAGYGIDEIWRSISPLIEKIEPLRVTAFPRNDYDDESRLRIFRATLCPALCDSKMADGNRYCRALEHELNMNEKEKVFILRSIYTRNIENFRQELNSVMSFINKFLQFNIDPDNLPVLFTRLMEDERFQEQYTELSDEFSSVLAQLTAELQNKFPYLTMPGSYDPVDLQELNIDEIPKVIHDLVKYYLEELMESPVVERFLDNLIDFSWPASDFDDAENLADWLSIAVRVIKEQGTRWINNWIPETPESYEYRDYEPAEPETYYEEEEVVEAETFYGEQKRFRDDQHYEEYKAYRELGYTGDYFNY